MSTSLWDFVSGSAAMLPNFRAIGKLSLPIAHIRDFTRSYEILSLTQLIIILILFVSLTTSSFPNDDCGKKGEYNDLKKT